MKTILAALAFLSFMAAVAPSASAALDARSFYELQERTRY
jgi:hypothetical protein